ncbi:MAG: hypothetical protein R3F07_11435 [Opitutaceae bacterium]
MHIKLGPSAPQTSLQSQHSHLDRKKGDMFHSNQQGSRRLLGIESSQLGHKQMVGSHRLVDNRSLIKLQLRQVFYLSDNPKCSPKANDQKTIRFI